MPRFGWKERSHDPRRWRWARRKGAYWTVEPMDAALARTPAFGQRFFAEMFRQLPALSANVTFLQWSTQPEHVWAFFDVSGGGFGGQVDPGLEYLIVWGPGGTAEYGSWEGEDQVPPAIDHVRTLVARVGL